VALVITFGFVIHLALVRTLKTRYVYLTGHLLFWMALVITACLVQAFGDIDQWRLVLVGSVIAGFSFWSVAEAVSGQPVIIMNAYGLLPGRGARPILGWHEIRRIRTVIVKGNGVTDVRFLIEARDLDAVKRIAGM
jgi:hypothetical protein